MSAPAPTQETVTPPEPAASASALALAAERLALQVRLLRTLNQLATSVNRFTDETALLNHVAEQLAVSFDADHIGVLFIEPGGEFGSVVAEYPASGALGARFSLLNNPLMQLVEESPNVPVIVNNAPHSNRITDETKVVFQQMGLVSLMVIALVINDEIIGTIGFDIYSANKTFSEDLIEIAQTMGAQLATGIQNIRLLKDAQRRADQMSRVAEFGQALQATLDRDALLLRLLEESIQLVAADRVQVALYDDTQDELHLVAGWEDRISSVETHAAPLLSRYSTYLGQTWLTGRARLVEDAQRETAPESDTPAMQDTSALRGLLLVPIRAGDRIVGAVSIGSRQGNAYTASDLAVFQQLAAQFGVAYANSELYAQSRRAAANEALVNSITAYYQGNPEVEDMLAYTLRELGAALGARRGRIKLALNPQAADTALSIGA